MQKKIIAILTALFCIGVIIGCGNSDATNQDGANIGNEESDTAPVMMLNPMQDSTEEEIKAETGGTFTIPVQAEDINYFMYRIEEGDFGEIQFTYDGADCSFRVKKADAYCDISGMYYEWDLTEEGSLGDCTLQDMVFNGENEAAQVCMWHDGANGIMYSLSVCDEDLDGFDIIGLATEISGLEYHNN